jgi:acid phosphatase type 7
VLAAALVAVPGAAAPALGAANLLATGGFEGSGKGTLAGWKGVRAGLTLRPDGRGGGHAARVARRLHAHTYSIVASPNPATTVAERRYRASGYLRSGRPGRTVCLKLLELNAAGRVVAQASGCRTATYRWRAFPAVSYQARRSGDALALRVVQTSAAARGDSFQVDSLALTAPGSDVTAPTTPTAFTAQAASSAKVALAWHASTDNEGLAGYTVYRNGTALATVGASATGYTDTRATAGKTYGYAVDAFDSSGNRSPRTKAVSVTLPSPGDPVIAAAGDIACDPTSGSFHNGSGTSSACRQMATSDIIVSNPSIAAVLTLGDDQYGCGGYSAFLQSYDPSWGRFKSKTHPAPGNHEYQTSGGSDCAPNAAGYFKYFGAAAGNAQADYAWNIGTWHMIALNGECGDVGGCGAGSPQGNFLNANLGASRCTLAYWHEPYYNGTGKGSSKYAYFWQTLYAAGADIVLNGHIHTYGRFAPQDPDGNVDNARGIREFIVGTGGEDHGGLNGQANVQATANAFAVLELTLHPASYDWKLVSTSGGVLDSGSAACH